MGCRRMCTTSGAEGHLAPSNAAGARAEVAVEDGAKTGQAPAGADMKRASTELRRVATRCNMSLSWPRTDHQPACARAWPRRQLATQAAVPPSVHSLSWTEAQLDINMIGGKFELSVPKEPML
mmetsp:Transcript_98403/g.273869  ORF Transcript_98403/g.273869 Transcript_98403/m.273869 type:complete len:123 (-) Transcript_98403:266-634(-)